MRSCAALKIFFGGGHTHFESKLQSPESLVLLNFFFSAMTQMCFGLVHVRCFLGGWPHLSGSNVAIIMSFGLPVLGVWLAYWSVLLQAPVHAR